MRLYETTFLIDPTLPEEEAEQLIEKMAGIVTEKKGKMINVDKWGKRRLAYPIKKFEDAVYVFFLYKGDVDIPTELERNFKQTESVIRYLTIKIEERENIRRLKKGASRALEAPPSAPRAKEKAEEETVVEEKPVKTPSEETPGIETAAEGKQKEKKEEEKPVEIPSEKTPKIEAAAEEKQEEKKEDEKIEKEKLEGKKKEEEKQEKKKEEVKTQAKKKDTETKDAALKKKRQDTETKKNEVVQEKEEAAVKKEKEK